MLPTANYYQPDKNFFYALFHVLLQKGLINHGIIIPLSYLLSFSSKNVKKQCMASMETKNKNILKVKGPVLRYGYQRKESNLFKNFKR